MPCIRSDCISTHCARSDVSLTVLEVTLHSLYQKLLFTPGTVPEVTLHSWNCARSYIANLLQKHFSIIDDEKNHLSHSSAKR